MANMLVYRTYPFNGQTGQDPVIEEVREALQKEGLDKKKGVVKELSGVSAQTLYNWFNGKTRCPRFSTVAAVYGAIGYVPVFRRTDARFDLDAELRDAKSWNLKRKATKLAAEKRKAKKRNGAKRELRAST